MICWAKVQYASMAVCWCFFCQRKTKWIGGAMLTGTFSLLAYTTAQLLYKDVDPWRIFRSSGICCLPNFGSLFWTSKIFFLFYLTFLDYCSFPSSSSILFLVSFYFCPPLLVIAISLICSSIQLPTQYSMNFVFKNKKKSYQHYSSRNICAKATKQVA